ncbi:MAG: alkaline phosphatase family protein [Alphaproteobacteria bacterium]
MARRRVAVIGLDSLDPTLIRVWAHNGVMPTFGRLFRDAAWSLSQTPDAFYVGAVWPSLTMSVNALRHGRYCYSQLRPGSYRNAWHWVTELKREHFWSHLSIAGRRVAIFDVPKSKPSAALNGTEIIDWGTHDPERLGFMASPNGTAEHIRRHYGKEPVGSCDNVGPGAGAAADFVAHLHQRLASKEAIARDILSDESWDFAAVGFAESHCVGHRLWSVHDTAHPRHDRAVAAAIGDPIRDVYAALDAALGRLLERIPPDISVLVVASHGIGPHYDGTHLMKEVLKRINRGLPHGRIPMPSLEPLLGFAAVPTEGNWRSTLRSIKTGAERSIEKSFFIPNNEAFLGVRVNLIGREPAGRIRPGDEFEGYTDALIDELALLTNGPDGPPAFLRVARTRDLYGVDDIGTFPDIVAEWVRSGPYNSLNSAMIGAVHGRYDGVRTGDHVPNGLVFALGPGMPTGAQADVAHIDLGPSVANLLGVAPADWDGRPYPFLPAA